MNQYGKYPTCYELSWYHIVYPYNNFHRPLKKILHRRYPAPKCGGWSPKSKKKTPTTKVEYKRNRDCVDAGISHLKSPPSVVFLALLFMLWTAYMFSYHVRPRHSYNPHAAQFSNVGLSVIRRLSLPRPPCATSVARNGRSMAPRNECAPSVSYVPSKFGESMDSIRFMMIRLGLYDLTVWQ